MAEDRVLWVGGSSGLLPSTSGDCLLSVMFRESLGTSSSFPGHETPGQKEGIHTEQAEAPCMGSQACAPQKAEPVGSVPGESSDVLESSKGNKDRASSRTSL